MRIGELARRAGVSARAIRYDEDHGVLPQPSRDDRGHRVYDDASVEAVKLIRIARSLGIATTALRHAATDDNSAPLAERLLQLLASHAGALEDEIKRLQTTRAALRQLTDPADPKRVRVPHDR